MKNIVVIVLFSLVFSAQAASSATLSEVESVSGDTRCPVCGMFVSKYQNWLTQLKMSDGSREVFDGVKDMMAYYFSPDKYGQKPGVKNSEVQVKDYYSGSWIDGKLAYYVFGSDVMGPMGHELIPFENEAAAKNFTKDHKGKQLLAFGEITSGLISRMRSGHKMKMKK
jgi:copper chaperone NosL